MENTYSTNFVVLPADIDTQIKTAATPPDQRQILHNHDGYEIFLLLSGQLNFYTEHSGKTLTRGDLVCVDAYAFHHGNLLTPGDYDRIVLNFRDPVLTRLSSKDTDLHLCFSRRLFSGVHLLHLSEAEIKQFTALSSELDTALKCNRYGDDLLIDAYAKLLLVMVNRLSNPSHMYSHEEILPEVIRKIFYYIEEHLTENFSIQQMADSLHHNRIYLERCFKKTTGTTLQQYTIAKKITLAQLLLREGKAPSDACFLSGFNNYSNFSRTFSKHAGCSPLQYQERIRKTHFQA